MSHSQWATHRKAEAEKGSGFTLVDVYLCVNVCAQTVPFLKVIFGTAFPLLIFWILTCPYWYSRFSCSPKEIHLNCVKERKMSWGKLSDFLPHSFIYQRKLWFCEIKCNRCLFWFSHGVFSLFPCPFFPHSTVLFHTGLFLELPPTHTLKRWWLLQAPASGLRHFCIAAHFSYLHFLLKHYLRCLLRKESKACHSGCCLEVVGCP